MQLPMIDRRLLTNFDWGLLCLVLLIVGIGVLNIASASASYKLTGLAYQHRQLIWLSGGLLVLVLVCSVDYHLLQDFAYWFYGIVIILLLAVFVVGKTSMGATRWLNLGLFTLQPSEPMKLVITFALARYFSDNPPLDGLGLRELLLPFGLLALPALLIMKQPDLGTAILVVLVAGVILFFVGIRWTVLVSLLLSLPPTAWLAWHYYLRPYQKNRILNFLNPERDALGSGYHLIQSKIAVGSGGLAGKGYLHGTQAQLRFLPEQHTDFAFSVFAEEWGFIGAFVVLLLYLLLILWGLEIARRCNDTFGSMLAVGVTAMLFWHTVINMGMVIGLFPVVGVPLPLFSYGGTSLVTMLVGVGLLLNIRMRRFMF